MDRTRLARLVCLPLLLATLPAAGALPAVAAGPGLEFTQPLLMPLVHDGTHELAWTFGPLCKGGHFGTGTSVWLTVNATLKDLTSGRTRDLRNVFEKKVYGAGVPEPITSLKLGDKYLRDFNHDYIVPPGKNTAYLSVDGCDDEDDAPPPATTSWVTTWATQPYVQNSVLWAKRSNTLLIDVYNPLVKVPGSRNGFRIMGMTLVGFTPMRITVGGAGVNATMTWDPNAGQTAVIKVMPTKAGTLRVTTSGQYYDTCSATVKVHA